MDYAITCRCASLLEWKPPGSNSVDFRLLAKWRLEQGKPGPQLRFQLLVQDREQLVGYDWLTVQSDALGGLAAGLADDGRADERVVECTFDPMHNTVRRLRRRRRRRRRLRA